MSKRPWIVEAIESPGKHPFIFIFVITFALSIASNGISTLILENFCTWLELKTPYTKVSWQLLIIIILVGFIAIGFINLSKIWQSLLGQSVPKSNVKVLDQTYKGLIGLMSTGNTPPIERAIIHHWNEGKGDDHLEHCWLIGIGDDSRSKSEELVEKLFREHGISRGIFRHQDKYLDPCVDVEGESFSVVVDKGLKDDIEHTKQLIEYIYQSAEKLYSLEASEIIIDFTGGQKPTTAGAILAGITPGRKLQFISSDYQAGVPIYNKTVEIDISYQIKSVK